MDTNRNHTDVKPIDTLVLQTKLLKLHTRDFCPLQLDTKQKHCVQKCFPNLAIVACLHLKELDITNEKKNR